MSPRRRRKGFTLTFLFQVLIAMDSGLIFLRIRCVDGTWSSRVDLGEDHFIGSVHFILSSPKHKGAPTRQIQRVVHMAQETPPHYMMVDPVDYVALTSSSSSEGVSSDFSSLAREPSFPYPFYTLSTPPDSDDVLMSEPEDSDRGVSDPTVAGMASPEVIMIDSSSEELDPSMDEEFSSSSSSYGPGGGLDEGNRDAPIWMCLIHPRRGFHVRPHLTTSFDHRGYISF